MRIAILTEVFMPSVDGMVTRLRRTLDRAFAGTRTTVTGMLTGRDLAAAYASADAFVFPSQTETPGSVLLEARAAARPVVAADAEATRDGAPAGGGPDPAPRSIP